MCSILRLFWIVLDPRYILSLTYTVHLKIKDESRILDITKEGILKCIHFLIMATLSKENDILLQSNWGNGISEHLTICLCKSFILNVGSEMSLNEPRNRFIDNCYSHNMYTNYHLVPFIYPVHEIGTYHWLVQMKQVPFANLVSSPTPNTAGRSAIRTSKPACGMIWLDWLSLDYCNNYYWSRSYLL